MVMPIMPASTRTGTLNSPILKIGTLASCEKSAPRSRPKPAPRSAAFFRLFQAIDDKRAVIPGHAFVYPTESRGVVVRRHAAESCRDGDVLLAAGGVADDAALM